MYKGREGMWAWVLHRVSGIGILLFLLVHIIDIALIGWGPEAFNKLLVIYTHPVFRIGEIMLIGAVLYHALNGIRVILIDFWSAAANIQRRLFYAEIVVFIALFIPAAYIMFRALLIAEGHGG